MSTSNHNNMDDINHDDNDNNNNASISKSPKVTLPAAIVAREEIVSPLPPPLPVVWKPHIFHTNLPSHFYDPTDDIPVVTKFGYEKIQQLIDLIFSIQLNEPMFLHTYSDDDNNDNNNIGNDTSTVIPTNVTSEISSVTGNDYHSATNADIHGHQMMERTDVDENAMDIDNVELEDDDDDDVEPVTPFGDTEVSVPTSTLLSVTKRCSRVVSMLSTIESLKCQLTNTDIMMKIILHLLRLVTATLTYDDEEDEKEKQDPNDDATKLRHRKTNPKLHYENVGTILQFGESGSTGSSSTDYDPFVPVKSEEQLEKELQYKFALPTPTRELLFAAIIHLISNKKGLLRSVSNASIYNNNTNNNSTTDNDEKHDVPKQQRSLLIIHWEVLLRMLLRTAPYLNEYKTSTPVQDSNSHTNTILKRTVICIRRSRRFFEQGIRPPGYTTNMKLDQTAIQIWDMVKDDILYRSNTHAAYRGTILLYLFLPTRCSTELYVSVLLPQYWIAWTNIDRMDEYDYLWLSLHCRARKYVSYELYSDGWTRIRKRILTHCQYWFQLPIGGTSYDASFPRVSNPRSRSCPSKLKAFVGNGTSSYDEAMDFIAKITKLLVTGLGTGQQISISDIDTSRSITEGTNDMLLFLAYTTPYFNPSNMGQWTATLGAFLHYFSYELCCRLGAAAGNDALRQWHPQIIKVMDEVQIGSHCSNIPAREIVLLLDALIPLCQQTLYSKNLHVGRAGEAAMLYLVQIDPIHTTPSLIDFTCRALDIVSINLSHQAPAAISALTRLIQPALRCRPYTLLSRLPNILHLTLAGIDCNDQNKAIRTLIFYRSLLCWIPIGAIDSSTNNENTFDHDVNMQHGDDDGIMRFGDGLHELLFKQRQSPEYKAAIETLPSTSLLKQGHSDEDITPDIEQLFLDEALSSLSDWSLEFLDRVFDLLRASGDREKKSKRSSGVASRHTSADVQQARNFSRVLKETLSQLFASMNDETHRLAIRTVYKFIEEETLPSAAKDASLLCQAASASRFGEIISPGLDLLLPLLCDNLSSHSIKTVTYRLRCLSGAVRSASHGVVNHRKAITDAITFSLASDNRYLFKTGCKLLRHTLTTLVEAYPHSFDGCPRLRDPSGNCLLGKSAELYNDLMEWHAPNHASMEFACDLMQKHVVTFLDSLRPLDNGDSRINILGSLDINDLRRGLRVIRYSIRGGASILLDSYIDSSCEKDSIPYEAAINSILRLIDDDVRESMCTIRGRISAFSVVLASIIASETFHPSGLDDLSPDDPCRKNFPLIASDPKICKETTDLSLLLLTRRGSAFRSQEARTIWEAQKLVTCDFSLKSQVDQIIEVLQCAAKYGCSERALYKDGEGGGKTIPRRLLISRAQLFHDTLQRNASFEIPRRLRIVERNSSATRTRLFNVKLNLSEMVANMTLVQALCPKTPLDGYEGIADCLYALCCHSNAPLRSSALSVIDYTMTRFGWLVAIRVPRLLSALSLNDGGMNGRFGIPSFCALSNIVNQQGRRKKLADAVMGVCSILSLSRAMKHVLQSGRLRSQFATTICGTDKIVSILPPEELQKFVHYMHSVFTQFRSRIYYLPRLSTKDKEYHGLNLVAAMNIFMDKKSNDEETSGENGIVVHWRKMLLACWFVLTFIDDDDIYDQDGKISCQVWSSCFRILEVEQGQPLQRVGLGLFGRLLHLTINRGSCPQLRDVMTSNVFCRILGEALVFDHKEDTSVGGGHAAQWATGVEDIIRDAARSVAPRNIFPFQRTNQALGEFKQSHSQLVELVLASLDRAAANTAALYLLDFAKEMISSPPSEDQRSQQITAAEIFGGICGSYFRRPTDSYSFQWTDILQPHLDDGVAKIPFALSGAYFDSLRYALHFSSPMKVAPLTSWIIDKLLTNLWQPHRVGTQHDNQFFSDSVLPAQGTEGFTTQSKWLYLFTAVLTEIDDGDIEMSSHGVWYKAHLLFDVKAESTLQDTDDPALVSSLRLIYDSVLPRILSAVGHPFDSCRDHISRCLFRICYCSRHLSRYRAGPFSIQRVTNDPGTLIAEKLSSLVQNTIGISFIERYNALSTARRYISYCVQLGDARFEYSKNVISLLHLAFEAIKPTVDEEMPLEENDGSKTDAAKRALEAEVIKHFRLTLAEVSVSGVISYGDEFDQARVLDAVEAACKHGSWQVRQAAIHFFRCFQGVHKFVFSPALTERTMFIIAEILSDDRREVCSAGMAALTGLLASSPPEMVSRLVHSYIHIASGSILPKAVKDFNGKNRELSNGKETKRAHDQQKSVYFLCAAILAQPYETPPYVPAALAAISRHSFERNAPLSVRDAVKRCCAEYKKNHMSDNWDLHRTVFSQEQLEALEDVVSTPHYYA